MSPRFPVARFLLNRFLRGDAFESVVGDLDEEYTVVIRPGRGRVRAWCWYWRQTLRSIAERRSATHPVSATRHWSFRSDVWAAWRSCRAAPGVSALAVATIALAIAASVIVFSAVSATLLRPLPYGDPDRLVMLWESNPSRGFPTMGPTPANVVDWRARAKAFSDIVPLAPYSATLTDAGEARRVEGRRVGWRLFPTLQTAPLAGRWFTAEEDNPGNDVVVLSYRLWREAFGGNPSIVGTRVTLNRRPRLVVGIMPDGFRLPPVSWAPEPDDLWVPIGFTPEELTRRGSHYLQVIARLNPGVAMAQAEQEMSAIGEYLASEHPRVNAGATVVVRSMRQQFAGDLQSSLRVLGGASALLLVIGCFNVAGLLIGRATSRQREFAVRAALGATGSRLMAHLLTEAGLLAMIGGVIGVAAAIVGLPLLLAMAPAGLLPIAPVVVDWRVLGFAVGAVGATALACGVAPALHARRVATPKSGVDWSRGSTGPGERVRGALAAAQIALACMLLVSAAVLTRSFVRLLAIDPGFSSPDTLLTLRMEIPRSRYRGAAEWTPFFEELVARLEAIPSVERAGGISWLPLTTSGNSNAVRAEHQPLPLPNQSTFANYRLVTPGYLEAMKIPLHAGRGVSDSDGGLTPRVVVVNQTLARHFWPGDDAVGKRVTFRPTQIPPDDPAWMTVVGVVADVRQGGLADDVTFEMFGPAAQDSNWFPPNDLVVRTSGDPMAVAADVRHVIGAIDRGVPMSQVRPMSAVISASVAEPRFVLLLVGTFAVAAVVLGAIGVYGLMSFWVASRKREIGVRSALGARPGDVFGLVVRQGAFLIVLGVLLGSVGAFGAVGLLEAQLFGVTPRDPVAFGVAVSALFLVGVTACVVPARRAAHVDPTTSLRSE